MVLALVIRFFGFVAYGLIEAFQPKDVSKMRPQQVFQWFICDPIPPSVNNINATGKFRRWGGARRRLALMFIVGQEDER